MNRQPGRKQPDSHNGWTDKRGPAKSRHDGWLSQRQGGSLLSMSDLPTGAVTLLFTDIEGSTRLVRQLRDRYAQLLAEHQHLLRAAFAKHEGHEIDTQGDAFFYAFGSANEAVQAAVEGQQALSSHVWPEQTAVRVRIGVHSARATPVGGRYTGLAVHRASRICSAGHGGQVLVSQATQSLLEDEEEELAASLIDLGEHRLKDIERPVRLYQVPVPGLPSRFPPPRGEAPPSDALESTLAPPPWRRRRWLAAAALAVAAVIAALFLTTRGSGSGLGQVDPNHVGVIDPATNEIVDQVQVGIRPGPVAVEGGTAWVGNLDDRTLTKIDVKQRTSSGTFPLDNRTPTGIAVGAGSVWIAHGAVGKLAQVDPQFGQVAETIDIAGEAVNASSAAVTVGEGSVWAVFADSTVARVDPAAVTVVGRTFAGSAPAGVVVHSGYVWVVNTESATAQRYQPSTFEEGALGTPTSVGQRPTAIAAGEGAVWVANTGSDTVTRIDPGTPPTTEPIRVGDGPAAVAVGAGAVWVANAGDGTVSRIDPQTYEVEMIETGNAPSGIAVGDGFVWVSVQAP
jgi:YVTN family beta-propeller protein